MKNSNDTIGNKTRDLPACSVVPQPKAPLRTPGEMDKISKQLRGQPVSEVPHKLHPVHKHRAKQTWPLIHITATPPLYDRNFLNKFSFKLH